MEEEKYNVPRDEIMQMAKAYCEVNSHEDIKILAAKEKEALSKLDYEKLLDMAAYMSVLVNAVFLSKTSRERIFDVGFNAAKAFHSRKASQKSHAETNEIKALIVSDYKLNKVNGELKDDAAQRYTKQYPLKFSTIRKYLKNI